MLIDLGQLGSGRRDAMRPQAEVFLRRAWDDATPSARVAYETWQRGAAGDAVWTALVPPAEGGPPPAFILVRDQAGDVDDPALRGQVVELGAPAWDPLRRALERWDTGTILRWLSADGWRVPMARTTARMAGDVPPETAQAQARAVIKGPTKLADRPATPVPTVTWQQAAIGGVVGSVVVGSVFFFLGKRSGEQSAHALEGT